MPLCKVVLVLPDGGTMGTDLEIGSQDVAPAIVEWQGRNYRLVMADPVPREKPTVFYAHPDTDMVQAERHAQEFFT